MDSLRAHPGPHHRSRAVPPHPRGDAAATSAARRSRDTHVASLVQSARSGDAVAWADLTRRFDRRLRHIARSYRLGMDDVDEIVQSTWLELLKAIERIDEPAAVGAWVETVTRRSALRRRQMQTREQLTGEDTLGYLAASRDGGGFDGPEATVLTAERRAALNAAVRSLPDRHRRLVTILLLEPALDYRQVAERLHMPIGSIGPTRARALARLARDEQLRAVFD